MDIVKVLHELDMLPARVKAKLAVAEEAAAANGIDSVAHHKTDREWELQVTEAWKKFVADKKKNKTMGVC